MSTYIVPRTKCSRTMTSIGSLSFAKLVMMLPVPAKSEGMPDTRPKIHLFVQLFPIQS